MQEKTATMEMVVLVALAMIADRADAKKEHLASPRSVGPWMGDIHKEGVSGFPQNPWLSFFSCFRFGQPMVVGMQQGLAASWINRGSTTGR